MGAPVSHRGELRRTLLATSVAALVVGGAACTGSDASPAADDAGTVPMLDATTADPDAGTTERDAGTEATPCGDTECVRGSCEEALGEMACSCDRHFIGERCDECARGYAGDDCDTCAEGFVEDPTGSGACIVDPCVALACGEHGTCAEETDPTGGTTLHCECDTGFAGDGCDTCAEGYGGDGCDTCADGWVVDGDACVEVACLDIPCGRHGTCEDLDGDGEGSCTCDRGWDGRSCEDCVDGYVMVDGDCIPDVCSGFACDHGTCEAGGSAPTCTCDTGWTGDACDRCDRGYVETVAGGLTTCENRVPITDGRMTGNYDASAPHTVETDPEGFLEQWFETNDLTDRFWTNVGLHQRPRYVLLPPAMTFDGIDDQTSNLSGPIRTDNHYSIFMVASWNPTAGTRTLMQAYRHAGDDLDGESMRIEIDGGSTVRFRHDSNTDGVADLVESTAFDATGARQLVVVERRSFLSGTAHRISNGVDWQSVEGSEGALDVIPMIFAGNCITEPLGDCALDGSIHEIVFVRGELTASERQAMIDYLNVKWGL